MALMKRSTFGSLPSIFDDIFDTDFFDNANYSNSGSTLPSVNVRESEEKFVIEVAAPGMKKDDFSVEMQDNVLSISAEKSEEHENKKYRRQEFNYQSFRRSFTLPKTIVEEKIEANYKDGVLKLTIPKSMDAKDQPARKISIR